MHGSYDSLLLSILRFWLWNIDFWHKCLVGDGWTDVTAFLLTRRQKDRFWRQVFEGNQTQQVANAIQPGAHLVIRVDYVPGSLLNIGMGKHFIFGFGIFHPTST